jgi:transcriptional regulator with XRE-family HTH domain
MRFSPICGKDDRAGTCHLEVESMSQQASAKGRDHPLGELLRSWRARRGSSQLDLALLMGVSQRHISFVESGRSTPSRALLLGIARALDVPLRDRNALLLTAGYAPIFREPAWDAAEMRSVNRALERMLRQHEPFPALVLDRYWNVLMRNEFAPRFFGQFIDMSASAQKRNLLHLMFDPNGLRPFVANWDQVGQSLFERIGRESIGGVLDERTQALIAELKAYPDVSFELDSPVPHPTSPVIPIGFVLHGRVLNYFSMISTVGTPSAVLAQELRVESMFPADDATEAWHRETFLMVSSGP